MLKAASLFYAIAISLVVSLVASSFVLSAYLNRSIVQGYEDRDRIIRNVNSGFNLLLANPKAVPDNTNHLIDLFGFGNDQVTLHRKSWGAFEIVSSYAGNKRFSHTKIAILGSNLFSDKSTGLYLCDQDKPLSIAGDTRLTGTCYLPKEGIKRAYIEGKSYSGSELVNGEIRKSNSYLPPFNNDLIANSLIYLNGSSRTLDSVLSFDGAMDLDTIHQSFARTSILVYSENPISIHGQSFIGNVILVSEQSITLGAESQLEDVLLYAPAIIIESGFTGSLQAFASGILKVEGECELKYPSVLGLISSEGSKTSGVLEIGEGSTVSGAVFAFSQRSDSKTNVLVKIMKDALVQGQVYSSGSVELRGTVYGGLACQKFSLATRSSFYENHLLDAVIDPSQLSEFFVGASLFNAGGQYGHSSFESGPKKIIKWIN